MVLIRIVIESTEKVENFDHLILFPKLYTISRVCVQNIQVNELITNKRCFINNQHGGNA